MKRIVFLILITLVICSFTKDEKLKWYSWNEGYELAKKEKKPMMVFLFAPWCDMCKRMLNKTFTNEEVIQLIQKGYIPVKFDTDIAIKGTETYHFEGKELKGKEMLLKLIPGPQLSVPQTIFWTLGKDKKTNLEGIMDPADLQKALLENMQ